MTKKRDRSIPSAEGFERRDSDRRTVKAKLSLPEGEALEVRGSLSLQGLFVPGKDALPSDLHVGALVGVLADVGEDKPLAAVCAYDGPPADRPDAGHMLSWRTVDFDEERRLARYLDADNEGPDDLP